MSCCRLDLRWEITKDVNQKGTLARVATFMPRLIIYLIIAVICCDNIAKELLLTLCFGFKMTFFRPSQSYNTTSLQKPTCNRNIKKEVSSQQLPDWQRCLQGNPTQGQHPSLEHRRDVPGLSLRQPQRAHSHLQKHRAANGETKHILASLISYICETLLTCAKKQMSP